MKIGTKMTLSFGVIIALIMVMAIISFVALRNVNGDLEKINAANKRMGLADDIVIQYKETVLGIRSYVAYGDEAYLGQVEGNFEKVLILENELLELARAEKKDEIQTLINETKKYKSVIVTEFLPVARKYNAELVAGNFAKAQEHKLELSRISKSVVTQVQSIEGAVDGISKNNTDVSKNLITSSIDSADSVRLSTLIISLFVMVFSLAVAVILTRMIRNPILKLTDVANQYANGDLRNSIEVQSTDEIGDLSTSLQTMQKHFVDMIVTIRTASEQLAAASEQMAASTEEVTSTSAEISRNMQNLAEEAVSGNQSMLEASQALVQLSSLIQIAKSKSENTRSDSEATLKSAENGRFKVTESVSKMGNIKQQTEHSSQIIGELSDYSQQISLISDTITNIAKQTNLLALNAAIEAARAGEHGRGFAVVAEEVRKLAEQSDHGAHEITSLVSMVSGKTNLAVTAMAQNVSEVEQGVASVNEAGIALDLILQAVRQTVTETREIGKVASEEVANSEQIVKLIDHLATVIETVAAHGEEVAASSEEQAAAMQTVAASAEETSAMAYQLKDSVAKFIV
jgi:methyl-accepting chemotaxis protein